ncbi:MAG: Chromosome-partitioning protein Spo0J [Syntrophorhabdaceae bacterium PtaU1.Bin034]|nr:MAG: Chromosome-partitioning protein Spo0J [Syntrophorhabdaceae bacterium PtaU1.Bin034]
MKSNAALAAHDDPCRPTILYKVPDGPQDRDYQCAHYQDCVSRVSLINKAKGFTCTGCPLNSNEVIKEEEHTEKGMLISVPPPCSLETVPLDRIILDFEIEEAFFRSLADSVSKLGVVLQPVMLVENGDGRYKVHAGKRRILSAQKKGIEAIAATVFRKGAPESLLDIYAIAENMNRGPNPADEAQRILRVMSYYHWTAEEAARKLSVPVVHVRQRLKLTQLIPEFFDMLKKGKLRVSVALQLASLPKKKQRELLKEEKLTLDKVEKDCRSFKLDSLLGDDDLFDVPAIERDPLEEAKAKILTVIEASESDTTLLREAVMLIDRYRELGGAT